MISSRFAAPARQATGPDAGGDRTGRDGEPILAQDLPLVSVVVPAYNAEATLSETLASVAAQTYRNLEIVVVDDGSTDQTREIATRFAATDARARVVSIPNSGVAVARNTGAAASSGPFLAPIDADDLWHPRYLETLVGLMLTAPQPPAFAYAACRLIDPGSNVIGSGLNAGSAGKVVYRMLFNNLVGNGSGMVIARTAFDAVGGYDARLRAAGCQGCEDYLLQLMLAEQGPVCAAGQYLIGYRKRDGAMSGDVESMAASRRLARRLHAHAFPHVVLPPWLDRWIRALELIATARNDWSAGRRGEAARTLGRVMLMDPPATVAVLSSRIRSAVRNRRPRPKGPRVGFLELDPFGRDRDPPGVHPTTNPFMRLQLKRLKRVATLDQSPSRVGDWVSLD
jgi:glycosyltransferase involved in cell wall biosynthesis